MTDPNDLPLGPTPEEELATATMTPMEYNPLTFYDRFDVSLRDAAVAAGLELPGWTWDAAIPQDWVDTIIGLTGITPVGMGLVWAYGPKGTGYWSGGPFPLTPQAYVLLKCAERLTGR